ncbi:MAG: hypothetical protein RLZZ204_1389 [Bacteroidota bacterium]|jgi:uncharacterized YccA/Bax inhibitor family protein
MALFNSSNPTLTEKSFNRSMGVPGSGTMTFGGTLNKFGFLFLMVMATAFYIWNEASVGNSIQGYMIGGMIGGLIVAIVLMFKPQLAQYLAPAYALLEGLVIGGISSIYNDAFSAVAPGIVTQAVILTFGTAIAMYLLYTFRIIRVTERFRSIMFAAIGGIALFYLITFLLSLFGVNVSGLHNGSLMSIGISIAITAIAALSLLLDFDRIEQGSAMGAPKYMEWYCAFGLLVTLVWLYIEILRLLGNLYGRRN